MSKVFLTRTGLGIRSGSATSAPCTAQPPATQKNSSSAPLAALFPPLSSLFTPHSSLLCSILLALVCSATHAQTGEADQMPCFAGCAHLPQGSLEKRNCSNEQLAAFIRSHLRYPNDARNKGIEGTVYVAFTVDASGRVLDPRVIVGIGGGCDEEALRVVRQMPRWEPARKGDRAVPVTLHLPIHFALRQDDQDVEELLTLTWGTLSGPEVRREEVLACLDKPVSVRDAEGQALPLEELVFVVQRGNQQRVAESGGSITPEMRRLVQRLRPGSNFTVVAAVQSGGRFHYVQRSFRVAKEK